MVGRDGLFLNPLSDLGELDRVEPAAVEAPQQRPDAAAGELERRRDVAIDPLVGPAHPRAHQRHLPAEGARQVGAVDQQVEGRQVRVRVGRGRVQGGGDLQAEVGEAAQSAGRLVLLGELVAAPVASIEIGRQPDAALPGGLPSAGMAGTVLFGESALDTAHAWFVGYTPALAVAVWVGNAQDELPLFDVTGERIRGETLPADVYRAVVAGATEALDLPAAPFPAPADLGDPEAGNAPLAG